MSAALLAVAAVGTALLAGIWTLGVLDALTTAAAAGRRPHAVVLAPLRRAAFLLVQQPNETERPDAVGWRLAPAIYVALAAGALALLPMSAAYVPVDVPAGIVFWGALEALVVVAVFLHGWSANALLPLLGAYRFVALGLSILLVSMFVLIAAALPAESMRFAAIVEAQRELWNVLRQPLGLPLLLLVGLTLASWGPLDFADSTDLAGGTAAEVSGPPRLVWDVGRAALLVSFAVLGATLFLGGWMGPLLPGPVWLALKSMAILALFAGAGRLLPRVGTERLVERVWIVLLPVSFLHLVLAGLEALA